ncbi:ABC transporter permease (plasmid) [Aliirhizobium terrae]|uniref:ABC transporter permease n=1 Tax=Terrirhizobium terrae TaxID=2926709 RepID=UPI002578A3DF|nr:ABC transporter permease [Rhizobium sp. CC-CFT758]WJH37973.1 ABC transporter permease [Rhizobium sp. CC-CFT758]
MGFLTRKLGSGIITLLLMTFVVFCLQSVVPSDPARLIAGPAAPAATIEALRTQMGLDDDIVTRYGRFLADLMKGDLGTSIRTRQPVLSDIAKYAPATLELAVVAMVIGILAAAALAVLQATYPALRILRLSFAGIGSAPVFLTSLLFVYLFWFHLGWLPGSGRLDVRGFSGPTGLLIVDTLASGDLPLFGDALAHLVLPACVLAAPIAVAIGQVLTSSLLDVMRQGYIRTARGKGLRLITVVMRHGLRNAANSALTMSGLQVRLLFGNILVVERIFGWPGLGMYTVQALSYSDFTAILGVALILGAIYITVGTLVEMAQRIADPRITFD